MEFGRADGFKSVGPLLHESILWMKWQMRLKKSISPAMAGGPQIER